MAEASRPTRLVGARVKYRGHVYYLAAYTTRRGDWGLTTSRNGERQLLIFRDGSREFWGARSEIEILATYQRPRTIRELQAYAEERRREEERNAATGGDAVPPPPEPEPEPATPALDQWSAAVNAWLDGEDADAPPFDAAPPVATAPPPPPRPRPAPAPRAAPAPQRPTTPENCPECQRRGRRCARHAFG